MREKDLIKFVKQNNIKAIGNEFCLGLKGEKKSYVREEVKELLEKLEKKNKFVFSSVKNALQNPELEHLFVRPKKENFIKRKIKNIFGKMKF